MDRPNRPYKGLLAQRLESDNLPYNTPPPPKPADKDSVIDAAKACLLIGGCTFFLGIGLPFFFAAFVLGVYAMATHRISQGIILSLSGIVLLIIGSFLFQLIWIGLIFKHLFAPSLRYSVPRF